MDNLITQEQILNISKEIFANSKTKEDVNYLLDEKIYNSYNVLEYKKKLLKLFKEFKSINYLYDLPVENNIRTISSYGIEEKSKQRNIASQVENAVSMCLDNHILVTDVYYSIIKLSYKLVEDEATYLIYTFFKQKSEDKIAELIGISKTYLQKIKKSCLVKMWTELGKYCKDE